MIRSSLSIARSIRHRAFSNLRQGGLFDQRCTVAKGSTQLGISVEKMGHLSESCVIASSGGSVVHVSVNSQAPAEAGEDFLPLTVDYRARMSAFGLIPEGPRRREKSPGSDDEILVARFIDRAIRPLFPSGYVEEVQVTVTNHATDGVHDPTVLALNATSAALLRSKQPWFGPVGCVRVGLIDGNLVVNPPVQSMKEGGFDLLYAGTIDRTLMIEAVGSQVSEDLVKQAIDVAHKAVREEIDLQKSLMDTIKSDEARVDKIVKKHGFTLKQEQRDLVERLFGEKARSFYREPHTGKEDRSKAEGTLISSILEEMAALPEFASELPLIRAMLADDLITKSFRAALLEDPPLRTDGRQANEVRPIECAAGVLPSVHGSSYFARGDTHVLSTVTIANMNESRVTVALDGSNNEKTDYFYLHYDFPPYCNGEVGALTLNRRMIGHGNLAERALRGVMPKVEKFPYVVRLMAECTSSNGSSSMASACSGTLALLEAGVPIAAPVAGISVGLVTEPAFAAKMEEFASGEIPVNGKYRILTDILGSEDHHGDMDFKIAGTTTGITAIQLDVKLPGGIPIPIIKEAIDAGKVARNSILAKMEPFSALKPMKESAPRAALIPIDLTRMTHLLSNGAEVLKYIRKTYDVEVEITEDDHAYIFGKKLPLFQEAASLLHDVATTLKEGDVLRATVVDVKDFGVFVRVNQGQEALVHISQLSHDRRIHKTELTELLHPGQKIDVKITAVDNVAGIISASRRELLDATQPDDDLFLKKSSETANDVLSQQFGSLTAKFPVTPARKWSPAYYRHSVATPGEIKKAMEEYTKKPQSSSNNNNNNDASSKNNNSNGNYKGNKNSKGGNNGGFQKNSSYNSSNGNRNPSKPNHDKNRSDVRNNNSNSRNGNRNVSSSRNANNSGTSTSDASSSDASSSDASGNNTSSNDANSADNSDKTESR